MKPVISVVAGVAAVVVVAVAAVAFVAGRRADAGPDIYAGSYPLITPTPTPTATPTPAPTWRPTGPPAGPLPVFKGTRSKVSGRITDRVAGLSYARFASPWRRPGILSNGHTSAQMIDGHGPGGEDDYWYMEVDCGPLAADLTHAATGPNALRAAAELYAQDWLEYLYDGGFQRSELAGQSLTVGGRRAWLTAFRATHTDGPSRAMKSQTEVIVAVDTGRRRPGMLSIAVPANKNRLLPDVNLVVRSLRVVR